MMIRKTIVMSLVGLSLALGACDKSDAGKDTKTAAKGKDTKAKKGTDAKVADAKGTDAKVADAKGTDPTAEDPEAEEKFDDRVVKAAKIANEIDADPTKTEEILASAGMDRAAFYALLYEVSAPDLAEQYRLARARAES